MNYFENRIIADQQASKPTWQQDIASASAYSQEIRDEATQVHTMLDGGATQSDIFDAFPNVHKNDLVLPRLVKTPVGKIYSGRNFLTDMYVGSQMVQGLKKEKEFVGDWTLIDKNKKLETARAVLRMKGFDDNQVDYILQEDPYFKEHSIDDFCEYAIQSYDGQQEQFDHLAKMGRMSPEQQLKFAEENDCKSVEELLRRDFPHEFFTTNLITKAFAKENQKITKTALDISLVRLKDKSLAESFQNVFYKLEELSPEDRVRCVQLASQLSPYKTHGLLKAVWDYTGDMVENTQIALHSFAVGAFGFDNNIQAEKEWARIAQLTTEALTNKYVAMSDFKETLAKAGAAAIFALPTLAAQAVPGIGQALGAIAVVGMFGIPTAGNFYREAVAEGADPRNAFISATMAGTVEAGLEFVSDKIFLKLAGISTKAGRAGMVSSRKQVLDALTGKTKLDYGKIIANTLKRNAGVFTSEIAEEVLSQAFQDLAKNQLGLKTSEASEYWETIKVTAISTAFLGMTAHGARKALQKISKKSGPITQLGKELDIVKTIEEANRVKRTEKILEIIGVKLSQDNSATILPAFKNEVAESIVLGEKWKKLSNAKRQEIVKDKFFKNDKNASDEQIAEMTTVFNFINENYDKVLEAQNNFDSAEKVNTKEADIEVAKIIEETAEQAENGTEELKDDKTLEQVVPARKNNGYNRNITHLSAFAKMKSKLAGTKFDIEDSVLAFLGLEHNAQKADKEIVQTLNKMRELNPSVETAMQTLTDYVALAIGNHERQTSATPNALLIEATRGTFLKGANNVAVSSIETLRTPQQKAIEARSNGIENFIAQTNATSENAKKVAESFYKFANKIGLNANLKFEKLDTPVNGRFDKQTNTIYINENSPIALETTIGHELTHFLKQSNQYDELLKLIKDPKSKITQWFLLNRGYANAEQMFRDYRELYSQFTQSNTLDEDYVWEEITADIAGALCGLNDGNVSFEIKNKAKNLWEKIKEFFKKIFGYYDNTKLQEQIALARSIWLAGARQTAELDQTISANEMLSNSVHTLAWKIKDGNFEGFEDVAFSPRVEKAVLDFQNATNKQLELGIGGYNHADFATEQMQIVADEIYNAIKERNKNKPKKQKTPIEDKQLELDFAISQIETTQKETGQLELDLKFSLNPQARHHAELEAIKQQAITNGTFMKAPNGKPTNLNEKQWLQVRTKAFKKWFGDWEHLAKVKRVKTIVPTEISSENYSAEDAERDYKNIGVATNKNTGKKAAFVNNSLWKILRHKGFNPVVIKELKSVFETSLPIIEGESKLAFYRNNTPHKEQSNIESYDHYVNKVSIDGKDYYVRFTLQNFKRSKKRTEKTSEFHSSFVSDVVLYESKSETPSVKSMNSIATEESFAFVDNRLLEWMNIVNEKDVSKIIDENGEPLVVYHGTNEKFNVFDKTKGRANMDIQGMFFSPWETYSQGYGSNVRSFFLNVKNPASFGDGFTALNKHKSEDGAGVSARLDLIKQGFDGVNNDGEEYIAFSPNQIKSATDNTGTFDSENADIRYSLAQQADNQVVNEIETVRERVEADGIKYSLIAYHGGNFDFEKPLREFRGKGEGNAAHGVGFYTALSKDVSKGYAERFARYTINGVDVGEAVANFVREFLKNNGYEIGSSDAVEEAKRILVGATNSSLYRNQPNEILEIIKKDAREVVKSISPLFHLFEKSGAIENDARTAEKFKKEIAKKEGVKIARKLKNKYAKHFLNANLRTTKSGRVLHTVSLPDDNGFNYLREDKPITDEQREAIEKELEKTYYQSKGFEGFGILKDALGWSVYKSINRKFADIAGNYKEAKSFTSDLLHRAGIIGIRYNGRQDGECAVMFDENDVEVIDIERWSLSRNTPANALEDGKTVQGTQVKEQPNSKLSLNMDAPRDLFYDPMKQIYDKARHDKFVKDKTNEELEALNTAATNYDSLLKIAKQAITLACWQVRNKRDNAPNWVINRLTKHLNDAERAIAVERAQMTYEIIKNRYGEIPNLSAENAITAEEVKENYKRVAVAQAKIRYARMQESFNEYYEKARVRFQRPDNKDVVKLSRVQKSQLDKHIDALTQLTAWNEDMKKAELEKARKLADKPIEPENTNKESEKETDEEKQKEISPEEKKAITEKVNANIDMLMVDLANIVAKNTLSQDTRENFDAANLENSYKQIADEDEQRAFFATYKAEVQRALGRFATRIQASKTSVISTVLHDIANETKSIAKIEKAFKKGMGIVVDKTILLDHRTAYKKLAKLLRKQKFTTGKKEKDRKMNAQFEKYLELCKWVFKGDKRIWNIDGEKVENTYDGAHKIIENLRAKIEHFSQSDTEIDYGNKQVVIEELQAKIDALAFLGGVAQMSALDVESRAYTLEEQIKRAREQHRETTEQRYKRIKEKYEPIIEGLSYAPFDNGKEKSILHGIAKGTESLHQRFEALVKFAKGEKYKELKGKVGTLAEDISIATYSRESYSKERMQKIDEVRERVLGNFNQQSAWFVKANEKRADLAKFASDTQTEISLAELMFIYAQVRQEHYGKPLENAKRNEQGELISEAHRLIEKRISQIPEMEKAIGEKGVALVNEFCKILQGQTEAVQKTYENITGRAFTMNETYNGEPAYFPIKRKSSTSSLGRAGIPLQVLPSRLSARVVNSVDIRTDLNFFEVANEAFMANEYFVAYSDVHQVWNQAFNDKEFVNALEAHAGKKDTSELKKHLFQTFSTKDLVADGDDLMGKLVHLSALTALGFNSLVMFKQTSSLPAAMFNMSALDWGKAVVSAFTPDGISAMKEIINDNAWFYFRFNHGKRTALTKMLTSNSGYQNKKGMALFYYMITNAVGDAVPTLIVGQGLLREAYKANLKAGMTEETAKKRAHAFVADMMDKSQQANRTENVNKYARMNDWAQSMLSQFKSTMIQYLAYDVRAYSDWSADKTDLARLQKLVKTVVLNHGILPSLYLVLDTVFKAGVFGDDDEKKKIEDLFNGEVADEVIYEYLATNVAGAFVGIPVIGTALPMIFNADTNNYTSGLPATETFRKTFYLFRNLAEDTVENVKVGDYGKAAASAVKAAGQLAPVVRHAQEIKENYSD